MNINTEIKKECVFVVNNPAWDEFAKKLYNLGKLINSKKSLLSDNRQQS